LTFLAAPFQALFQAFFPALLQTRFTPELFDACDVWHNLLLFKLA